MKLRICSLGALAVSLVCGSACDGGKDDAGEAATAAAGSKEANAKGAALVGSWVRVEEFGGGDCDGLDCSASLPKERQTTLTFEAQTYSETSASGPAMTGSWTLTEVAGGEFKVSMTLDGIDLPPSKKTIVFQDGTRFTMRADNRHGGVYKRATG